MGKTMEVGVAIETTLIETKGEAEPSTAAQTVNKRPTDVHTDDDTNVGYDSDKTVFL